MPGDIHISRRNLPHWTRPDAVTTYWVTFRLADSIPQTKLRELQFARQEWIASHPEPWDPDVRETYERLCTEKIEGWLDAGYGSRALALPEVRAEVLTCLLRFDKIRLHLPAAVIMPTHVHALITPLAGWRLPELLKGIKGASARAANRRLDRSGAFWLDESYDHIVRDETEFSAFVRYIETNPRRAGLGSEDYWLLVPQ